MLRITKKADYAIVMLTYMGRRPGGTTFAARDLAGSSGVGLPMASKILKELARAGVLVSQPGVKGGYFPAPATSEIYMAEIIEAVEGPIAITECSEVEGSGSECVTEALCPVRGHWQRINHAIVEALEAIPLREMTLDSAEVPPPRVSHTV